jgi:ParB family chromosome partitioning protein
MARPSRLAETPRPLPRWPGDPPLAESLQQHLATHVVLHHHEKRGRIEVEYYGNDDLQRILGLFGLPQEDA